MGYNFYGYYRKRKRRLDTVPFSKLEELRKSFGLNKTETASLLDVSTAQLRIYRIKGKVPSFRFIGIKSALLRHALEEFEKVKEILNKFDEL